MMLAKFIEYFRVFKKEYSLHIVSYLLRNTNQHKKINKMYLLKLKNELSAVPYYKKTENMNKIINKDIIRKHFEKLKSSNLNSKYIYLNSSGGSTGEPITIIQDKTYKKWLFATFYYYTYILTNKLFPKELVLWGSEEDIYKSNKWLLYKLYYKLTNKKFLNSFYMDESIIKKYIIEINLFKPELIRGYAGSLYKLAEYIEKNNIKIHKPIAIWSAAEVLYPYMRKKIERAFNCKVYNFYGSREVGAIAGECKEGTMHVFQFNNDVKIMRKGKKVDENMEGKVIITTLHNYSFPLVNYDIGDYAIKGNSKCKCGIEGPTLKNITGRTTDHFVKKDGSIIHGEYFTHLFYYRNWIKEFQIIQEKYNLLNIYIVKKDKEYKKDINEINQKIKLVMGNECTINWNYVKKIDKTRTGKYLYTICKLNR